jgi:putative transposase
MVGFIDDQRGAYGVDPICKTLPIAPSTYCAHPAKQTDPALLSDRAKRDVRLRPQIELVFAERWKVFGMRKIWRQLRREGVGVARCTAARPMKDIGIQGIFRGKPHRTTIPDKKRPCPLDKMNRQFRAPAPNMLRVSDFTYVAACKGFAYVAFVIDTYAQKIVGWRVSTLAHAVAQRA